MLTPNAYSAKWFESFAHLPARQTEREADWIVSVAPPDRHRIMLDLCCGFGRHAGAMRRRGYTVVGVDRDASALRVAASKHPEVMFVAADMRDVARVFASRFDLLTILWQSFGYFDASQNAATLRGLREIANDDALLLLDVYDASFFATRLEPREATAANGQRFCETKSLEGGRLQVKIEYESGSTDLFDWQVFSPEALSAFAAATGWQEVSRCASFDSQQKPTGDAPRMQFVFRSADAGNT